MAEFIPKLQERLGRTEYPHFSQSSAHEFKFANQADVSITRHHRWLFHSRTRDEAVVIAPDFVAVETRQYRGFERLVDSLGKILAVLSDVAAVQLSERSGLRYVNRIVPSAPMKLLDYFQPGLRGLDENCLAAGALNVSDMSSRSEVRCRTATPGSLVIRVEQRPPQDTALPFGLEATDLDIDLTPCETNTAFLDIDHFLHATEEFHPEHLVEVFWGLHDYVDLAFRGATTPEAIQTWGHKR